MKSITKHVERSSQEQTRGGKQITRAIESISEMVSQLNNAQREQARGGEQILMAVDSMRDQVRRFEARLTEIQKVLEVLGAGAQRMRTASSPNQRNSGTA